MTELSLNRRAFLQGVAAAGASGPLLALMQRMGQAKPGRGNNRNVEAPDNGGYGPLQSPQPPTWASSPLADRPWLSLPAGFTYGAFGHTGEMMSDGNATPADHDGMAAFPDPDDPSRTWLVRNHELSPGEDPPVIARAGATYDPGAAGGTTNLLVDLDNQQLADHFASIGGTTRNCAGGPTPWGSWLTCEETFDAGPNASHGYVFEVPADDTGATAADPLTEMGRFVHEAVAVDPNTGIVYETEDRGTSGLYRFIPDTPGQLSDGGRLQMLAIKDRHQYDTRTGQRPGRPLPVEWVDIDDPDPDSTDPLAVYKQGLAKGGATFDRLEGAWSGNGSIYVVSTSGGDAGVGQVWEYRPRGASGGQLILGFESPGAHMLDSPDNVTVSPNGGLVLCEDGDGVQYLRGVTRRGEIFDLATNAFNGSEVAGATFSPDGSTLFFNIQTPGVTLAITGPWENGAL